MDKRSFELAQASLEIFSKEISPLYDGVRADLLAQLALSGTTLADFRKQEETERQNRSMLSEFVEVLPVVDMNTDLVDHRDESQRAAWLIRGKQWDVIRLNAGFTTKDPAEAQSLLSQTVWLPYKFTRPGDLLPYYVLGHNANGNLLVGAPRLHEGLKGYISHDHQEALKQTIRGAYPYSGILHLAPHTFDRRKYQNHGAVLPDPSPDAFRKMYERSQGDGYLVNAKASGATVLRFSTVVMNSSELESLTDQALGEYNVFDHLNNLAVLFGGQDTLQKIYDKRAEQSRGTDESSAVA